MSHRPVHVPKSAKSWIEVAPDSDFPIQNLPLGCMAIQVGEDDFELIPVSAIGDQVILLPLLIDNDLMEPFDWPVSPDGFRAIRQRLYELFSEDNPVLRNDLELQEELLLPLSEVALMLPMQPTGFVDFYSGIYHASNVGKMFRPDMPPLLPNYRMLPVAYNGRASTLLPNEYEIERPAGIYKVGDEVVYEPTRELDFELELGVFIGEPTVHGTSLPVEDAEDFVMGVVLVNDWSARDVQRFEYQPLGPFLGKSFGTTVGPWMVHLDALQPFRTDGVPQEPEPLFHLRSVMPAHFDLTLEVWLKTAKMKRAQKICTSNAKNLYWTFAQQITHMTSNGGTIDVGDLLATGTISGETPDSFGSMLELSWKGERPLVMEETGETRSWLEDGDTVSMRAYGQADGYRVGLGTLTAKIVPHGG